MVYCFIHRKYYRMSELCHGQDMVLTYYTIFLGLWVTKLEYTFVVVLVFLSSKQKLLVGDKKIVLGKRVLNPHIH